jgi:hypothetical protein
MRTCYPLPRGERKALQPAPSSVMPDLVRGDGGVGRPRRTQAVFCFSILKGSDHGIRIEASLDAGQGQDVHLPPRAGCPVRHCGAVGDAGARWSGRSYAAIAREGFMRNPVAHRATRMIAEAAASVPWVVFDQGRRAGAASGQGSAQPARSERCGRRVFRDALRPPGALGQWLDQPGGGGGADGRAATAQARPDAGDRGAGRLAGGL